MTTGILGKKLGMSQVFDTEGKVIPVTVIEAGPCTVIQRKTARTDGYDAVQIGFRQTKAGKVGKPMLGHFQKAGKGAFSALQEIRVEAAEPLDIGAEIKVDIFKEGDVVDVMGHSKGRGFTGVIKRWNFKGGRATHGSQQAAPDPLNPRPGHHPRRAAHENRELAIDARQAVAQSLHARGADTELERLHRELPRRMEISQAVLMVHSECVGCFLREAWRAAAQHEHAPPGVGGVRIPPLATAQHTVCAQRLCACRRIRVQLRGAHETRTCLGRQAAAFVQPPKAERLARRARAGRAFLQ